MKPRKHILTAVVCLPLVIPLQIAAEQILEVSALTPTVEVSSRSSGRKSVRLPALEYSFEIDVDCSDQSSRPSLFVNIADTGKSISADDFSDDASARIKVQVPADQIAPVIVENFCVSDQNGSTQNGEELTIESVLSAQSSLLCADGTDERTSYVTTPLDVTLRCTAGSEESSDGQKQNQL